MKTIKTISVCLAMLLSVATFATKIPVLSISLDESENTVIKFESPDLTNFVLTITDEKNQVVFSKKSEQASFKAFSTINFNEIGDGNYKVLMNFGNCSVSRNVIVTGNKIEMGDLTKKCAPYFQIENDGLKISFFNKDQERLYLNIFQDGNHVDGFKLGKNLCIQKYVDISRLKKGNYEFILSDNLNHQYTFSYNK